MAHRFACRVYYEDTDLAGIVYYANYLKFIERARSEWVAALGIDQRALRAEAGMVFAVRRIEADYLAPARFGDVLEVTTAIEAMTPARAVLRQEVARDGRGAVPGAGDAGGAGAGRAAAAAARGAAAGGGG